jgi:hypothetical protein
MHHHPVRSKLSCVPCNIEVDIFAPIISSKLLQMQTIKCYIHWWDYSNTNTYHKLLIKRDEPLIVTKYILFTIMICRL